MLFRVAEASQLKALFELLAQTNTMLGPVKVADDLGGNPVYSFEEVAEFSRLSLDYTTTRLSAKRFFLPFREDLAVFALQGKDWSKQMDYHMDRPAVLFGLHACDINALNRLDKVLMGSDHPVPYYAAKRKNIFIIGTGCTPRPSCFCRSMGTNTVTHGFDLFVTDIGGGRLFFEIFSSEAYHVIRDLATGEPTPEDHNAYMRVETERNRKITTTVDTTDLTKILDMEFQSPVWKTWGDKCLGCGSCASACPTCYCYGVEETVDPGLREAKKTRTLYSCNIVDFAEVAGGHNFRPERGTRLKYRYYHKHRGFVEAYEESLCVGCGRCGDICLAGITVPEVIASVRGGDPT
ncbi:MAG: 4Fe-4S dicluster domain-containing protein [Nitrospiraceae bacterium]|nr:4Fe-4S dicluster domain-containing protein [Nitrospiraceae bacterium]